MTDTLCSTAARTNLRNAAARYVKAWDEGEGVEAALTALFWAAKEARSA